MASNTSSWLDFAQRSRDQGGLGLAPHQASGLVGNLVNESGPDLPAWGPSGDNGTAWGTAQWRGDRLDNLKAHAQANGLDYRTPEAQQAFMRHEFDTSENPAYQALQAATTPEEAATAVNTRYERSADRSGNREAAARSLYQDGPTAIQTAMGGSRRPTGKAMGYAATPDDDEETPPALSSAPPPGPLTQGPSKGNWLSTLGDTLMSAAPGIASISDPDRAKALATIYAASQKTADNGTWSTGAVDPKSGIAVQTNNKTGQTRTLQVHSPQPDEVKKVDPSILKELSTDWTSKYGNLQYAAERAAEFKKSIDNGEIDPSLLGRGQAAWESMWGKASPQSQKYNDFQAFRTQLANDSLRLNKGVQTEGDAERARQELTTQTGAMDKATLSHALHNFIDKTGKVMNDGASSQLDSYAGNYPDQKAAFSPYYKQLEKQKKFYTDYASQQAAAPAAPAAGNRPPLKDIFK